MELGNTTFVSSDMAAELEKWTFDISGELSVWVKGVMVTVSKRQANTTSASDHIYWTDGGSVYRTAIRRDMNVMCSIADQKWRLTESNGVVVLQRFPDNAIQGLL
jgi:hypothetical protein